MPSPNHRAKWVYVLDRTGSTLKLVVHGNLVRQANVNEDCLLKVSEEPEHDKLAADTLTNPQTGASGWLWLRHGWCTANGVATPGDPKLPVNLAFCFHKQVTGRIVSVSAHFQIEGDHSEKIHTLDLRDVKSICEPPFAWPREATFALHPEWLMDNADIDMDAVPLRVPEEVIARVEAVTGRKTTQATTWTPREMGALQRILDDLEILGSDEVSDDLRRVWTHGPDALFQPD